MFLGKGSFSWDRVWYCIVVSLNWPGGSTTEICSSKLYLDWLEQMRVRENHCLRTLHMYKGSRFQALQTRRVSSMDACISSSYEANVHSNNQRTARFHRRKTLQPCKASRHKGRIGATLFLLWLPCQQQKHNTLKFRWTPWNQWCDGVELCHLEQTFNKANNSFPSAE